MFNRSAASTPHAAAPTTRLAPRPASARQTPASKGRRTPLPQPTTNSLGQPVTASTNKVSYASLRSKSALAATPAASLVSVSAALVSDAQPNATKASPEPLRTVSAGPVGSRLAFSPIAMSHPSAVLPERQGDMGPPPPRPKVMAPSPTATAEVASIEDDGEEDVADFELAALVRVSASPSAAVETAGGHDDGGDGDSGDGNEDDQIALKPFKRSVGSVMSEYLHSSEDVLECWQSLQEAGVLFEQGYLYSCFDLQCLMCVFFTDDA